MSEFMVGYLMGIFITSVALAPWLPVTRKIHDKLRRRK